MNEQQFHLPKSKILKGIEWLEDRISYPVKDVKGDTFPMTWAQDDAIYTSAGDPWWGESVSGLDVEKFTGSPRDYKIEKIDHMNDYLGWGGNGPKPTGMICVDDVLYLAFQNLLGMRIPPFGTMCQHGSDAQIIMSRKVCGFWTPWAPNIKTIKEPMFPGHKFGGPAFVNFGKNNENARDEYVYAVSGDQWDNGSNVRLGRVHKDHIMQAGCWEWVCSFDLHGNPAWSHDLNESIPVLSMHRTLGIPDMVYLKSINRYLLFTWSLHKDFSPSGSDLYILESPEPWGPFSLVHYEEYWEGKEFNPYCPRLPLKWVEDDGLTCWLQFSGNWGQEMQPIAYRSSVRRFRFVL